MPISFLGKVETIRSSFESSNAYIVDCSCNSCSPVPLNKSKPKQFGNFTELTQDEVCSIIMKCANKTCNLDTLPTWLVKDNVDAILPCITDIVNSSLKEGIFPEMMKQAIVTPILKKINSDWNDLQNYRPVSNIGFVSKVIEKAAMIQVDEYMQSNDLDEVNQSVY